MKVLLARGVRRVLGRSAYAIRLPGTFGNRRVWLSPRVDMRYLTMSLRHADPSLLQAVDRLVKPADTVWDIGACMGVFGLAAADRVGATGHVLMVEPDHDHIRFLDRSLADAANTGLPAELLCAAVGNESRVSRLCRVARGTARNHLAEVADTRDDAQTGGTRRSALTLVVTLDYMLEQFPAPAVVKIDVEGMESRVLDGGSRLLRDVRPAFYVEVQDENVSAVTERLLGHDYLLFDGDNDWAMERPLAKCVFNTVTVPTEKRDAFA